MAGFAKDKNSADSQALLKAVAEELKLPLIQIARHAELARLTNGSPADALELARLSANTAIELVDSYMLGLELAERQQALALEPVSVNSVLYDVAHQLDATAKRYGVSLEVSPSSCGPVMANPAGLRAAMLSIGTAFIEVQPQSQSSQSITLATHRTSQALAAGIYSSSGAVSPKQLHQASQFTGWARQPLSQFSSTSAAGIFIAKTILESMAARLRTAHYHKQAGLAAILTPSQQLRLI